jgi:hypothetical protein
MMQRYGSRTIARKLGIQPGMSVALRDAPRDYAAVIGDLPVGATLLEDSEDIGESVHPLTLWFVHDSRDYRAELPAMRKVASRGKLWIVWRKGSASFTGNQVREYAIEAGLVDYKICALGEKWSGMLFAIRKS